MFGRIFSMIMAVVLLVTVLVTGLCWKSMRDRLVDERLEALKKEARETAYLASRGNLDSYASFFYGGSDRISWLEYQAESIYSEYGAYILVVDRYGSVMDNMRSAYHSDPDFVSSLDSEELTEALMRVLRGEEIALRMDDGGNPTFTVGVPYVRNGSVLGAVLIRTPAQTIESGAGELLLRAATVALAVLLLAALLLWLYLRRALSPLKQMTLASEKMAEGDFTARAESGRGSRELREMAAAFNSMAEQLSDVERSRREFVANVSHELRSPMTSITGFVEGMQDGTIPPEEHPHYLAVVSQEARRLTKLVEDLLALSRLEREDASLNWSDFDICEMLRRAMIRRIGDLDARELDVVCDFQENSMQVHGDSDRIEQVVVNLLDNAIKFTPDKGRITLRCRAADGLCTVTVADSGKGVTPENRERIFERFFTEDTAHTAGKGTGLGLSICRRIMRMHGQNIVLDDVPEGASFSFTLETAKERTEQP